MLPAKLADFGFDVHCTGGRLIESSLCFVGSRAIKYAGDFHFDIMFFSFGYINFRFSGKSRKPSNIIQPKVVFVNKKEKISCLFLMLSVEKSDINAFGDVFAVLIIPAHDIAHRRRRAAGF